MKLSGGVFSMAAGFESPAKFVRYCQFIYSRNLFTYEYPHSAYRELNQIQAADLGVSFSEDEIRSYRPLVESLDGRLRSGLAEIISSTHLNKIAVGAVESGRINAFCLRSEDGVYAILFNYALFLYLNKAYKLRIASVLPQMVTFCNRGEITALSSEDYSRFVKELAENYRTSRVPYGALVKLHQSLAGAQSHFLIVAEMFILCHEVAHILLKHLENRALVQQYFSENVLMLRTDLKIQSEYDADRLGFALMCFCVRGEEVFRDSWAVILALEIMFESMADIEPPQSASPASHPSSKARFRHIFEVFHGKDLADAFLDSDFERRTELMKTSALLIGELDALSGAPELFQKA